MVGYCNIRSMKIVDDDTLGEYLHVLESPIHGRGLFAREFINAEAYLGTYYGPETQNNGIYVLWVEDDGEQWVGCDGKNILRYLNHAAQPNVGFEGCDLFSLEDIQAGDEVCFHYGDEFEASLGE